MWVLRLRVYVCGDDEKAKRSGIVPGGNRDGEDWLNIVASSRAASRLTVTDASLYAFKVGLRKVPVGSERPRGRCGDYCPQGQNLCCVSMSSFFVRALWRLPLLTASTLGASGSAGPSCDRITASALG